MCTCIEGFSVRVLPKCFVYEYNQNILVYEYNQSVNII